MLRIDHTDASSLQHLAAIMTALGREERIAILTEAVACGLVRINDPTSPDRLAEDIRALPQEVQAEGYRMFFTIAPAVTDTCWSALVKAVVTGPCRLDLAAAGGMDRKHLSDLAGILSRSGGVFCQVIDKEGAPTGMTPEEARYEMMRGKIAVSEGALVIEEEAPCDEPKPC